MNREDFRHLLNVNVVGTASVIAAFLPQLRVVGSTGRKGRVVTVSSGLGMLALPVQAAYSASKFAIEGMSDALRRELQPVRVLCQSCVRPCVCLCECLCVCL